MTRTPRFPLLQLRPRPSRWLPLLVVLTHALALTAIAVLPLDWGWRLILAAMVVASLWHGIEGPVRRRLPWSIREAHWHADGHWELRRADGQVLAAPLSPSTYVGQALVILNFQWPLWSPPWRRPILVLPADALETDTLRRLRLRLRIEGVPPRDNDEAARSPPAGLG